MLLASLEQAVAADIIMLAHLVGVPVLLAARLLAEGFLVERAIALVFAGTGIACHLSSSLSDTTRGNRRAFPLAAVEVPSTTGSRTMRSWGRPRMRASHLVGHSYGGRG